MSHEHKLDVDSYFSEVIIYFTPLSVLEHLGHPDIVWGSPEHIRRLEGQDDGPFRLYNTYEVKENDVQHLAIFDNDGDPWIAIVTKDNYISFFHCQDPGMIILKCPEHPNFHFQVCNILFTS
jgi:hypothetical protein